MWKQKTIGHYVKGTEQIKIQMISIHSFILWKNEEYEKDFQSLEALNAYLIQNGLEILYLPLLAKEDQQWHHFEGERGDKRVFTRKKENGMIETVLVRQFDTNRYVVYAREATYNDLEILIETTMEFAEVKKRNPKTDLELDAYEITTHGASGMDERYNDLRNEKAVNQLLREKYGIIV